MSKQVWKPGTILSPLPTAMVSCGTLEKPNIITIGWTGIINTHPAMTYISVRPTRFSHKIISESREFVINITPEKLVYAADWCGVKSGEHVDKFNEMGLDAEESAKVQAPAIKQCPISIECKVTDIVKLGSHDMFMAEIVAVCVGDEFVDKNGKLDIVKCGLVAFAHGEYFALGKSLGTFGYSVKKKAKKKKTNRKV